MIEKMNGFATFWSWLPLSWIAASAAAQTLPVLRVPYCQDFPFAEGQVSDRWQAFPEYELKMLDGDSRKPRTHFRIAYSDTGIYVQFTGDEWTISTEARADFEDLFLGDVYEVFLQPDPATPLYLEYEVNARGHELVLLVPNIGGRFMGWTPWKYTGDRKVRKNSWVAENPSGQAPLTWHAELFFPYTLFRPLCQSKPAKGTVWKGNFYRIDYDTGNRVKWAWTPINVSFHEFAKYGTLIFD